MLTLQVYALVMMGILTMTVQRRYQHHHPVLVCRQTDYVLSGQENAKEQMYMASFHRPLYGIN
jgi:hypothetical protein